MRNNGLLTEERQFITKEFAAVMAGKTPSPYLRLHDFVQNGLAECAAARQGQRLGETAYLDRMIHFWREVSVAGLPRCGKGLDECYALLFESAFDLAESEPEWALECLAEKSASERPTAPLTELARQVTHYGNEISHINLATSFTVLYAPWREREEKWSNELSVAFLGDQWFWTALLCAASIDETHSLWRFRCALSNASVNGWRDNGRLNLRLIREAPRRSQVTPRAELMAHPILRMARLKYSNNKVEQRVVLRFLNARCIAEGFESEEDRFCNDLAIARWLRDARRWAEELLRTEPQICAALFDELGRDTSANLAFYREELGERPETFDDLDAIAALMRWARRRRGHEFARYRGEIWEFVVETVDAALWLGWLFPRPTSEQTRPSSNGIPMDVSTSPPWQDLQTARRVAPSRHRTRATKQSQLDNAAIRKAVLKAVTQERSKAAFTLFGRGHEPRISLSVSVAAVLRDLNIPRVHIRSYGANYHYPRRVFVTAVKILRKKLGRSPIVAAHKVYRCGE